MVITCCEAGCICSTGSPLRLCMKNSSKSCSSRMACPCLPALAVLPILWMYWACSDGMPTCAYPKGMLHHCQDYVNAVSVWDTER